MQHVAGITTPVKLAGLVMHCADKEHRDSIDGVKYSTLTFAVATELDPVRKAATPLLSRQYAYEATWGPAPPTGVAREVQTTINRLSGKT